jgi:hypothetical protein
VEATPVVGEATVVDTVPAAEPTPGEPTRTVVVRVLVGTYVAVWTSLRATDLLDTLDFASRRFDPIGPLAFLNGPLPALVLVVAVAVTPVAAAVMAWGRAPRIAGPAAAIGFLLITTYRNSWGQLHHTENLVALHLIVLAMVPFVRRRDTSWAMQVMAVLTVGTYFLAGVAKLRISGVAWLDGDVLRHQIAFDNARKEIMGDPQAPLGGWILRQGWLLGPAALMTLIVELGAPFALLNRRIAAGWCGLVVAFHIAIIAFMAILFPYHVLGIGLAPLLPVERLGATVSGWSRRFPRASTRSAPTG